VDSTLLFLSTVFNTDNNLKYFFDHQIIILGSCGTEDHRNKIIYNITVFTVF